MEWFNKAYKSYYNFVCTIAQKIIKDDPSDIADAAFLKLSECSYADDDFKIKQFLRTTTVRLCLDHIKKKNLERHRIANIGVELYKHEYEIVSSDEDREKIKTEVLAFLYEKIKQLPPKTRQCFELFYFKQLTCQQISEQMNVTINTVHKQIYIARCTLKMDVLFNNISY